MSDWEFGDVAGFRRIAHEINGAVYRGINGLVVISSVSYEADGKRWLHVSYSRADRIPNYNDTTAVKKLFIGEDKKAIMIFPDKAHHVNIHKYCLHLFYCIDGDTIPEFSKDGML